MLTEEKFELEKDFVFLCKLGPEVVLYFIIDALGGFIWRMNHDMADGRIPEEHHGPINEDLKRAQQKIEFAVDHTVRFGVPKPRNEDGHATADYLSWFRWWDTYTKGLSNEEFHELEKALAAAAEALKKLSAWRPDGDWRVKKSETTFSATA